jgi:orotate phosphoribosyltransferase
MTLIELLAQHAFVDHPEGITLSSGQTSAEYVDCTTALGRPGILVEVGNVIGIARSDVDAIGGVAMGGIAIAVAVSARSRQFIHDLPWFYIRNARKDHGTSRLIEGAVKPGDAVCIVDDVVTTGESVISAVLACQDYGLRVVQVIVLVDREQSGLDRIRNVAGSDVPVSALCTLSQIRECAQAMEVRE